MQYIPRLVNGRIENAGLNPSLFVHRLRHQGSLLPPQLLFLLADRRQSTSTSVMDVFRRRLYCHFCNQRTPYARSAGIRQFQCTICDAINTLDDNGDIDDSPPTAASSSPPPLTFTQPLPETLIHQQDSIFCRECQHNQLVYNQTLANYLPGEEDPDYQKYEDALPQFKTELERRHPQICAKCAPRAQHMLNRADVYAATDNMSRLSSATRRGAPRSSRDDWSKRWKRWSLNLCGLALHASLLVQLGWHAYEMLAAKAPFPLYSTSLLYEFQARELADTRKTCNVRDLSLLSPHCLHEDVSKALWASLLLLWYNPGLRHWYHPTHRIAAVVGQGQYYILQGILLVARTAAFHYLSTWTITQHLSASKRLAFHGLSIVFIVVVQLLSRSTIEPIIWKLNMKITPKPGDRSIFGMLSGPGDRPHHSKPSDTPPTQLFAQDNIEAFPIASLAPRRSTRLPTPPYDDYGDAMDIDPKPSPQTKMPGARIDRTYRPRGVGLPDPTLAVRSPYSYGLTPDQPSGWAAVRNETFQIQSRSQQDADHRQREQDERTKLRFAQVEPSPFRGRLPQAPMSMERRLRNPPTQVSFKKTPLSEQQGFMNQMRDGIQGGTTFAGRTSSQMQPDRLNHEVEETAASRTRGQLDLRQSKWQLPSNGRDTTGLEDMFGGSFNIADRPTINEPPEVRYHRKINSGLKARVVMTVGLPFAVFILAMSVEVIRRPVALWLLRQLTSAGMLPHDGLIATAAGPAHPTAGATVGDEYDSW